MVPTEATTRTEIVFETQRLLIRRFKPTDLQDAYEIYSDPEVAKYEFWDPFTLEETREDLILQGAVLPGTYEVWNEFAVQLRDEGKLIGNISFHTSEPEQKQAEIGFHFNRAYHGRGYGRFEPRWRCGT